MLFDGAVSIWRSQVSWWWATSYRNRLGNSQRELQEETGYSLDSEYFQLIDEVEERRPGLKNDTALVMISVVYRGRLTSPVLHETTLEGYEIDYQNRPIWCSLDQAYKMNELAYQ